MIDPSTTEQVRFAIVGAGTIAKAYGQAFQESQVARLVAVADVQRDAAESLAAEHNAEPYAVPKNS